jgi:hypothetical protein
MVRGEVQGCFDGMPWVLTKEVYHTFQEVTLASLAPEAGNAYKLYLDNEEAFCYKKHKL